MKRILTVLCLFGVSYAFAQQDPYYTHFKDVQQAYNPAAAGQHKGHICISALTHHQWRGYNDETHTRGEDGNPLYDAAQNIAPQTHNVNVGTAFEVKKGTQFIGAGISLIQDQVGYSRTSSIMANLNYRMRFQGGFQEVALGVGVGGTQWGFKDPEFKPKDPNDPKIPVNTVNEMKLDLNVGAIYRQKHLGIIDSFYAGLSVTNINQAYYKLPLTNNSFTERTFVPHYYALAGGEYEINGTMVLEPAVLFKFGSFVAASPSTVSLSYKPQFDLNATVLYMNTLRGGIAYRQWGNADAISILLGYVKQPLQVGYSYDITTSGIQRVSNGTHEIFVKYCIPIVITPPEIIIRETPRFL